MQLFSSLAVLGLQVPFLSFESFQPSGISFSHRLEILYFSLEGFFKAVQMGLLCNYPKGKSMHVDRLGLWIHGLET
jgi:hypothetical protein